MKTLKFQGDIGLDDVFNRHKIEIYDNLLSSIGGSYQDFSQNEVTIVKISINDTEYTINLSREKFVSGLKGAISFYESCEEYEKCAECLRIINAIKNNEMEVK
ncbi:hypothetical protein UFOVP699_72 [uncultured Caudovirales phage]|uniref:Uncharacterized protein n=1 Tax=uncultured Caudovirales phage TaxID=2100421 RepID=A0A6J5NPB6_9CAUD|nr:hypothetical protein UFOVP699_72 [uncultured Caudovirales phage]